MTQNTKLALIYGGGIVLASAFAYYIYSMKKNKPIVIEEAIVDEVEETPIPQPTKPNPFTELLNKPLPAFSFKPTDYSVKNPFADVNTAIANVNPFSVSNSNGRLA
jgi:hypothetical protein